MSHFHAVRNQRSEGTWVKQTAQYVIFLVVCVWLLYQIHHSLFVRRDSDCDYVVDERIVRVLGRKGGASQSLYTEELKLYGLDLVREANVIMNVTEVENDQLYAAAVTVQKNVEDFAVTEGNKLGEDDQTEAEELKVSGEVDGKDDGSVGDGQETPAVENSSTEHDEVRRGDNSPRIELGSELNAVILKKDDTVGIFRFSDEDGVPVHESGPSRRSDIQVEGVHQANDSSAGNQSMEMEGCKNVCPQNASEKNSLKKTEKEAVSEEVPETMVVETGKERMRDLLSDVDET